MDKTGNKFLLAGDKFMPKMYLKQPGFTFSAPFTTNKERIQKFMQTGNANYICRNDLDKGCFEYDMAYSNYKDLVKRTESDKVLKNRAFKVASKLKYDGFKRGLASRIYKFFDKKSADKGIRSMSNQQLTDELHEPITKKSKDSTSILLLKTIFGELILLKRN